MRKKVEFLGIKIPIISIMIALLIIGTASAAVFYHYAVMQGNVTIGSPISVSINGNPVSIDETYMLSIANTTSPCYFNNTLEFNNSHGSALDVTVFCILYEDGQPYPDLNASVTYWIYTNETIPVPVGHSEHNVSLYAPAYMMGEHTLLIEVNPIY